MVGKPPAAGGEQGRLVNEELRSACSFLVLSLLRVSDTFSHSKMGRLKSKIRSDGKEGVFHSSCVPLKSHKKAKVPSDSEKDSVSFIKTYEMRAWLRHNASGTQILRYTYVRLISCRPDVRGPRSSNVQRSSFVFSEATEI